MENGFGVFRINGKPQMHVSPYDTGSYNTAGASWKSNMTPSARAQIAGQSASDESSCMAHTRMPTPYSGRAHADLSRSEYGAVGRLSRASTRPAGTRPACPADIARVVDATTSSK